MTDYKPVGKNILVQRDLSPDNKNGILLVASAQDRKNTGMVISIPDDLECPVKVSDKVLFFQHAGVDISNDDSRNLLLIRYQDILAIALPPGL